jgi:hypothetical protein
MLMSKSELESLIESYEMEHERLKYSDSRYYTNGKFYSMQRHIDMLKKQLNELDDK